MPDRQCRRLEAPAICCESLPGASIEKRHWKYRVTSALLFSRFVLEVPQWLLGNKFRCPRQALAAKAEFAFAGTAQKDRGKSRWQRLRWTTFSSMTSPFPPPIDSC